MQIENNQTVIVDLRQTVTIHIPRFRQFDTNILNIVVKDNKVDADMTNVTKVVGNYLRPDGQVVTRELLFTGNIIEYKFGAEESAVPGDSEVSIHLLGTTDNQLSSKRLKVIMDESLEAGIEGTEDLTLLRKLFQKVEVSLIDMEAKKADSILVTAESRVATTETIAATVLTKEATAKADTARALTNTATTNANTATSNANTAKDNTIAATGTLESVRAATEAVRVATNTAKDATIAATTSANTATGNANTATNNANVATGLANTAKSAADVATGLANAATTKANTAATTADTAKAATIGATTNANTARDNANTAASSANSSAVAATLARGETLAATAEAKAVTVDAKAKADYIASKIPAIDSLVALQPTLQTQLNNLVLQKGTDIAEVVQARGGKTVLNERLNAMDTSLTTVDAKLADTARQTTTLGTGVSVVSAADDALASVEIEGRTLTSLGNSNLEAAKKYALTDAKTKVIVTDGVNYTPTTISGVAKFTKAQTLVATGNFVGKVQGNYTTNPHYARGVFTTTLNPPVRDSSGGVEFSGGYSKFAYLDNSAHGNNNIVNEGIAQHLFSFDIIAEIERKLGVIPKSTVSEKVQWVKDSVENLTANWHGFGSSVGSNKGTLTFWNTSLLAWSTTSYSTTSGTVSKVSYSSSVVNQRVDDNGFAHFLAYAEPSDGVTPSTINTDYVELVVTLKPTAQLNTRPTIIRVENFEGKASGSTVENAHVAKSIIGKTTLGLPTEGSEFSQSSTGYNEITSLNSTNKVISQSATGGIAQQLFSFNLIEAVERNIGRIPRSTVADKVAWLKTNVNKLTANWHGFGSSVGGNKASFCEWGVSSWATGFQSTNTSSSPFRIYKAVTNTSAIANIIQSDGFAHFLAYAEPSDGVVPSVINTDYIDLEFELKPEADFTNPCVALYEVADDAYNKILVDWDAAAVATRYPIVEGTQHLNGVGVIAEGKNLMPPFTSGEWSIGASSEIINLYELRHMGPYTNFVSVGISAGEYYLSVDRDTGAHNPIWSIIFKDSKGTQLGSTSWPSANVRIKLTVPSGTSTLMLTLYSALTTGPTVFKNPMLTLDPTIKPFVPRNPSSVFADVKLGAFGTVRDTIYEDNGRMMLRKAVEKDVALGGDLAWKYDFDYVGHKKVYITLLDVVLGYAAQTNPIYTSTIKYDGKLLKTTTNGGILPDVVSFGAGNTIIYTIHDVDTGFGEVFIPSVAEIKAYFYGWKMNNGTFGTNYEATGTKTWIPIGDTTNARAVTVVPTSPSPTQLDGTIQPYKLSYVLATPVVTDVATKVEGALKVSGQTQVSVDSGYVVREKVTPVLNSSFNNVYEINRDSVAFSASKTKNKAKTLLHLYKNGQPLSFKSGIVAIGSTDTGNGARYSMPSSDYDPTAEYTVTYLALEKPKLTANPTNVKLTYANSIRNALDDAVTALQDSKTMLSIHEKAIIDLYVRVKALEV